MFDVNCRICTSNSSTETADARLLTAVADRIQRARAATYLVEPAPVLPLSTEQDCATTDANKPPESNQIKPAVSSSTTVKTLPPLVTMLSLEKSSSKPTEMKEIKSKTVVPESIFERSPVAPVPLPFVTTPQLV